MFNFDGTPTEAAILGKVLKLEVVRPDTLQAGSISEAEYKLTNIAPETVDVCIDGQGVSTWVSSDQATARFPSVLYSIAFDAPCYTALTLTSGETERFVERLVVPRTFPLGSATLHGTVAVKWPKRRVQEIIGTTAPLQIVGSQ